MKKSKVPPEGETRLMKLSSKSQKSKRGFSLIESLIGILLIVVVFLGMVGAFRLGLKVLVQSKARVTALALANQRIEEIRNLPYNDVGTVGGIPPGVIPQTETKTLNNIEFTIATTIIYIDDPFDGLAPDDLISADYKRAKVKVFWPGIIGGEVILITDVAPKGIETVEGGGTLSITVLNATGDGVGQATVRVVNDQVDPPIDASYLTDDYGNLILAGAPTSTEAYQITVTKSGYSSERTYSREEIANPLKPHASVYEGDLTEISFAIDQTGTFLIETRVQESFDDDFNNFSKTSEFSNVEIEDGEVRLETVSSYASSGYLVSEEIAPANLVNWDSFVFRDFETEYAIIKYQIYAATSTNWFLIPDSDLPYNSIGLEESPVDLSGLDISKYPKLKLKANFETSDPNSTPYLDEWHVYYNTPLVGNVEFHLRGDKILGTDAQDQPVYKYSSDHRSDYEGKLTLTEMEWDSYNFSETENTGMDLLRITPSDPVNLLPGETLEVGLYFKAENSLLVTVLDSSTGEAIFGANVRLYNLTLGYDENLPTDQNGKAYFVPLEAATYSLEVGAFGYQTTSTSVSVLGSNTKTIYLIQE
jgi:type II secretory pathway pseudopilin PulG